MKSIARISPLALALLAAAAPLPAAAQEEDAPEKPAVTAFEPPQAPQPDRYRRLWEQSPFTVRAVAAPVELPPNFIEDLKLIGIFDTAGKPSAILQRLSTEEYITVRQGEDSGQISLVGVIGEGDLLRRRVELRAGNETASLGFDSTSMIPQPGPGAVRGGAPPQPGGDAAAGGRGSRAREQAASNGRGAPSSREEAIRRAREARDARGQGGGGPPGRPGAQSGPSGSRPQEGSQPNVVPRRRVVLPQ